VSLPGIYHVKHEFEPSFQILASISHFFERSRQNILFALVNKFEKDALATEVNLAGALRPMTLEQAPCRRTAATTKTSAAG
jgi:hypothetical protein